MSKMAVLRAAAVVELSKTDVLLVPTALSHFTIAEVRETLLRNLRF